ncbi:calcium uptake protein 3, mitochondrial-like [Carassius auratus]|uniref:Calcium uptake protein 3, mitochondrial-like n=1 Tax=Carassius auratus TaxID=7957 RepID=A0A6P6Q2K1_CARAU|nr:calcium uptake protein 3, mitochondrial-like [Carassius auratus]
MRTGDVARGIQGDRKDVKKSWRSLTKQELEKILSDTPPVWKGTSKLFRNLREQGIIAYTEYLFRLCILTKPHAGFKIAFNMFDADGNQMVDMGNFLCPSSTKIKESQELVPRSFWDMLRRGASQALFSDLAEGITFDEFRSFFQFLNNLEDFAIAIQMFSFACRSIGQDEFARAVYVATGLKLTRHLVNTIFKIFVVDHDDQLSYKEFTGIMKDRLHRGGKGRKRCRGRAGYKAVERFTSFKPCLKRELAGRSTFFQKSIS